MWKGPLFPTRTRYTSTPYKFYASLKETTTNDERDLSFEAIMKIQRPIPNGEFISIQINENSTRTVIIGDKLPALVERDLINCLKVNVDLSLIFPDEISDMDPNMACHQLNIYLFIRYMDKRMRWQSPKNLRPLEAPFKDFLKMILFLI